MNHQLADRRCGAVRSPFVRPPQADAIDVSDGFTGIEVASNWFPNFNATGYVPMPRTHAREQRASTGARVTVMFSRRAPLPPNTDIRVRYDIAENGGVREMVGIPRFTHTNARYGERRAYHYRLSHWIPALSVMRFVQA
jgi:hypothetical protein